MSEIGTQKDYWNWRAHEWADYAPPLIPSRPDIEFQREALVLGGDALVLGATTELCELSRDISGSVLAVDYAQDVIDALRMDKVDYVCQDWFAFFEQNDKQFDNIMTDGGLLCLQFPESWEAIAAQIHDHLKPGGTFAARVYVNTLEPPKESYENPNLNRFVTSMGRATLLSSWMVHPQHGDYEHYDVHYAFPPEDAFMKIFGDYTARLVPEYEEGQRFVSYAWKKAA